MPVGGIIAIVVVVVIVLLIALIVGMYNSLVTLNERVNEAWSDITVQLKYRADLIPNVVETVKGYAKHEKETFQMVTEARSAVMGAKTVKQAAEAEKEVVPENEMDKVRRTYEVNLFSFIDIMNALKNRGGTAKVLK